MKIKSHTGEMVGARVGMVVKTARFNNETVMIRVVGDSILKGCVRVEHTCGLDWVYDNECTMLHCPFVVGDEVEVRTPYSNGEVHWETQMGGWFEALGRDAADVRHADPNLRDSPDYKPELV